MTILQDRESLLIINAMSDHDRAIALAIEGLKELMEANFRTVHVQLEQLARLSPDVETLKQDVAEIRASAAARQEKIKSLNEQITHLDSDYMRRDEIQRNFVPRSELDTKAVSFRNTVALTIAALSLIASIAIGIAAQVG